MNRFGKLRLVALIATLFAGRTHADWSWQFPPQYVSATTAKRNNVFYVGETVAFTTGSAVARYEVRNYYGTLMDQGTISGQGTNITFPIHVQTPGWYKLYLYGSTDQGTPWGYIVGGSTFVIFRNDARFPSLPAPGTFGGENPSQDEIMRGITGMGPQRYFVQDCNNPADAIAKLDQDIAVDEAMYIPYDPVRKRVLMIAFPNGTSNLAGVAQIVAHFQDRVQYWEPRNEPNSDTAGSAFATGEMKSFYQTVKSVNPALKVLGPGLVSLSQQYWIDDFLKAGGGNYIDAFSFHAYNNVDGDFWLARTAFDSVKWQLKCYGFPNMELWQTELGYMAAVYGAYEPRLQGRWTMVEMMAFEQAGIPKEHNHLWYDKSQGYWDFPMFAENEDTGFNPSAALMRVWSEELYGKQFVSAYDFGTVDNNIYVGSLFQSPTGTSSVAAFMTNGNTVGKINLSISGGVTSVQTVDAFGVTTARSVIGGFLTLPVSELPIYVELGSGQTCTILPRTYGTNVAVATGVTVQASGSAVHPGGSQIPNDPSKIVNGVLEDWYWRQWDQDQPWMSNVSTWPATIEIDLPQTTSVSDVIVHAATPWQWVGTLLDYDLQYWNGSVWTEIEHITEPTNTFANYTPAVRCTVDSYFSDRCIFEHHFSPVSTAKIRLVVNDVTYGGGATALVAAAGGQTGFHQVALREVQIFQTPTVTKPVIVQSPGSQSVALGSSADFSVVAQGTNLSYLWSKDGQPIIGATTATLHLASAGLEAEGSYVVTVSNTAGSMVSQAATLTINTAFNTWASGYFTAQQLSNPVSLLSSTPYGDGVPVIEKYFFHLDPTHAANVAERTHLPQYQFTGTGQSKVMTVRYLMNPVATDIVLTAECATNLGAQNWKTVQPVSTTSSPTSSGDMQVQMSFSLDAQPDAFYRLRLSIP